jgi:hypothetical protein
VVPGDPPALAGLPDSRRGTDWIDGAVAGWLLVSAAQTFGGVGGGVVRSAVAVALAGALAGAVIPFLRFLHVGWTMAVSALAAHAVVTLVQAAPGRGLVALLLVAPDLLALAYLVRIRGDFAPGGPDRDASPAAAEPPDEPPSTSTPAAALAELHRRISAAGSACRVDAAELRAIAARHGVGEGSLRAEGIALYRTFLLHFAEEGPSTGREERELACLATLLELDPGDVAALRAGVARPLPAPRIAPEPERSAIAEASVELFRVAPGGPAPPAVSILHVDGPRDPTGLTRSGRCRLLLTGEILTLLAPSGARSPLPLERFAGARVYADGLEVHARGAPTLFLRFAESPEPFAVELERMLRSRPSPDPEPS